VSYRKSRDHRWFGRNGTGIAVRLPSADQFVGVNQCTRLGAAHLACRLDMGGHYVMKAVPRLDWLPSVCSSLLLPGPAPRVGLSGEGSCPALSDAVHLGDTVAVVFLVEDCHLSCGLSRPAVLCELRLQSVALRRFSVAVGGMGCSSVATTFQKKCRAVQRE
jgi:hypothetical protein